MKREKMLLEKDVLKSSKFLTIHFSSFLQIYHDPKIFKYEKQVKEETRQNVLAKKMLLKVLIF